MTAHIRHIKALTGGLLCLLSFHSSTTVAQSLVGPTVSGNIVMTRDNLSMTQTQLSGGGEIGLVYEWQQEHLLLRTGAGYSMQCPSLAVDSQWLEQNMRDTRDMLFLYRGMLARRTDRLIMHQLTVPLMLGGTWHGVYVLGGFKFTVALANTSIEEAALRTAGDYQGRYYDWFENMPNHGYHDFEPVRTSQTVMLKRFDLRLAVEAGYTFRLDPYAGRRPSPLLRAGLFAEYGLFNLCSADSNEPAVTADWSQYLQVSMTHIYASSVSKDPQAHLFLAGIRLTWLFQWSEAPEKRYRCRCAGVWSD